MDILQPQKDTRKKLVTGSQKPLADKRIADLKSSLYGIRDAAKDLQKKNPELLLYEAMDRVWEDYAAKKELDVHIENFKKIGRVKIPGTNILMPPFDFKDDHVKVWFNERLLSLKKNNSNLTYGQFIKKIAEKIECYDSEPSHIANEEFLFIFGGKIVAMAPDLWEMEEFDWDDPESQKWLKEEEEKRIKKYGKLTYEQYNKIVEIKETLLKENTNIKGVKAFDLAWEKVTGKKLSIIEK
ncbi:MAG: hypothetical protein HYW47_05775 [Deltaproteobacteria bacterium]|nr:hypothetical protein [Deltaproteobacteria bacterium]